MVQRVHIPYQVASMSTVAVHCSQCGAREEMESRISWGERSRYRREVLRDNQVYQEAIKRGWRLCHGRAWICMDCLEKNK